MIVEADADGVIRQTGETYEVVFTRRIARPIEKVWAALTVPERLADWLANATIEPDLRLGARFALHFPTHDYRMEGEIVALDPPRLIAWTWPDPNDAAKPASVVRFELAADGAGCVLTLTNSAIVKPDLRNVAAGWHTHLDGLPGAADAIHMPWSAERAKLHAARYEALAEKL
jgi:uncharacterized protein YndB with AHSA1/START domain